MKILNNSKNKVILAGVHIEPSKTGIIEKEPLHALMADFTVKTMFQDGLLMLIREEKSRPSWACGLKQEEKPSKKKGKPDHA
jgi:hypothetical protein